jgi:hypothetical protein
MSFRINVTGMQGTRRFLEARGVTFAVHNPTVDEVRTEVAQLRTPHGRHAGHKGCLEAADTLERILRANGARVGKDETDE